MPLSRRATDKNFSGPLPDRIRHARRLAALSQAALARAVAVGPSAVAQWELPQGTSPTVEHLGRIAICTDVMFEWLATGRGVVRARESETPAVQIAMYAMDVLEERLLVSFRRIAQKKRTNFVRWLEEFV